MEFWDGEGAVFDWGVAEEGVESDLKEGGRCKKQGWLGKALNNIQI